jgi:putative membrane protein
MSEHPETDAEGTEPAGAPAPPADPPPSRIDVRFSYANERTFLAWNRTALALVTAGLAITQLLPPFNVPGGRRMIGMPLIILGIVVAIASLWQWRRNEDAMHADEPLPSSPLPMIIAVVIGISATVAAVLAIIGSPT